MSKQNSRTTPKDVDPKLVDRFLKLHPTALKWATNALGGRLSHKGYTREDLVGDAFAYGHWWQYGDRSDGFFTWIIKFDMMQGFARWTHYTASPDEFGKKTPRAQMRSLEELRMDGHDWEIPGEEKVVDDLDLLAKIINEAGLSRYEKSAIRGKFWDGKSFTQQGKERNVTPQTPAIMFKRGMAKLRQVIGEEEL